MKRHVAFRLKQLPVLRKVFYDRPSELNIGAWLAGSASSARAARPSLAVVSSCSRRENAKPYMFCTSGESSTIRIRILILRRPRLLHFRDADRLAEIDDGDREGPGGGVVQCAPIGRQHAAAQHDQMGPALEIVRQPDVGEHV